MSEKEEEETGPSCVVHVFESRPTLSEQRDSGAKILAEYTSPYTEWTMFYAPKEHAPEGGQRVTIPNIGKLEASMGGVTATLEYKLCDPAPVENRPMKQCPGLTMISLTEADLNLAEPATHIPANMKQEDELVVNMSSGESLRVKVRVHEPLWTEYDSGRPGVYYYYHVMSALVVEPTPSPCQDGTPPLPAEAC